jgi:hypothetical protein
VTIAVALKVRDGLVLAADSATTMSDHSGVRNIYNHANKIVNLKKGRPIGFMTWGVGGFRSASIEALAKDFRADWDETVGTEGGYTMREVAEAFRSFLGASAEEQLQSMDPAHRGFGFMVAGHTPQQSLGEGWVVHADPATGTLMEPEEALPGEVGLSWYGQPQWIQRLVLGVDFEALASVLGEMGLDEQQLPVVLEAVKDRATAPMLHPAMPIQDAIRLAGFLVEVTKGATDHCEGHLTVGGPTEIAAITKHEGFKWVARKHYYDAVLNPATS